MKKPKKKKIGMTDQEYVDKVNNGEYSEYNFIHDQAGFILLYGVIM